MALRNDDSSKIFGPCNPLYSQLNFVGRMSFCRKILTFGPPKLCSHDATARNLFISPGKDCLNYSYCHGAHKGSELPRSFTKGSGRIVTIKMKLFNLVLVICHFCWQICQHSIVKIAFNFAKAVLGCLIIRQMWLPRNFVCTFAKACQGHAMNFIGLEGLFSFTNLPYLDARSKPPF